MIKNRLLRYHRLTASRLLGMAAKSETATWTALPWNTATAPERLLQLVDVVADTTDAPTGAGAPAVSSISGTAAGAGGPSRLEEDDAYTP